MISVKSRPWVIHDRIARVIQMARENVSAQQDKETGLC